MDDGWWLLVDESRWWMDLWKINAKIIYYNEDKNDNYDDNDNDADKTDDDKEYDGEDDANTEQAVDEDIWIHVLLNSVIIQVSQLSNLLRYKSQHNYIFHVCINSFNDYLTREALKHVSVNVNTRILQQCRHALFH